MNRISIGISTCPNDTFAFFPLVDNLVDTEGLEFDFQLLDVQQLNEGLMTQQWDVAKASFHAALLVANQYTVFNSGSALGFGNGPLLLAACPGQPQNWSSDDVRRTGRRKPRILCPGKHTTATLLYRLFYPDVGEMEQVVFSEIMPALEAGEADFGVCIHEGRFTYQEQGLSLVEDLGQRWETETGQPLPLGGIVGNQRLGQETLTRIDRCLTRSIQYALTHRNLALPLMKRHAQELQESVIWQHVDLYVNRWTEKLGTAGADALAKLSEKAAEVGVISSNTKLQLVNSPVGQRD